MPILSLTMFVAAALVLWVYHHDRYEKEPWPAVLVALVAGFVGMWVIGFIDDAAIVLFDLGARENLIIKAAVIALIEEIGKLFVIVLLARAILRRHFNDPMDGLIYGRLVGLAMAVEESLLYLSLAPATMHTLGMEVVRLFAHSLMGGLIGFAVGLGGSPARARRRYPRLVVLCLLLSTLLHLGWNVIAYAQPDGLLSKLIPMAVMLTLMVTWRWLCGIAENRSRELFSAASAAPSGRADSGTAAWSAG